MASPVEGSLDIFCEKTRNAAKYTLLFAPNHGFGGGTRPVKEIQGDKDLASYLSVIGFDDDDVRLWIRAAKDTGSISIPNVWMPAEKMSDYESKG
jgi:hypothetical protein